MIRSVMMGLAMFGIVFIFATPNVIEIDTEHKVGEDVFLISDSLEKTCAMNSIRNFIYTSRNAGDLAAPQLLSPPNGSTVDFPLTLHWSSITTAYSYTLEYSKSLNFSDAISLDIFNTEYVINSPLQEGRWHWHVKANAFQSGSSLWSAVWSFEVGLPVPQLLSPADGTIQKTSEVCFDWTDLTGSQIGGELYDLDHYNLQYSINSTFESQNTFSITDVEGFPLRDSQYGPFNLADGTYYWRVRAIYIRYPDGALREGAWSNVFSFNIYANTVLVELVQPVDTTLSTNIPTFTWKISMIDYKNVANWTLEYTSNIQMQQNKHVITGLTNLSTRISDNYFFCSYTLSSARSLDNGKWYWHVIARDITGNIYTSSPVRSFVVIAEIPVKVSLAYPPNGLSDAPVRPTFSWIEAQGATSYWLQVDNSSNFSSPEIDQDNIATTSYVASSDLEPQGYYWRVNSNAPNTQWSETWFFIIPKYTPQQVALISPSNGAKDMPPSLLFKWQPLEGANSYTLEISTSASFASLVVKKTGLVITSWGTASDWESNNPSELEDGTYYWRVSSNLPDSTSAIWNFTVKRQSTGEKISLTVIVSNIHGEPLSGATITLKEDGSEVATKKTDASGQAVIVDLESGIYTMEVTAEGYRPRSVPLDLSKDTTKDTTTKKEDITLYRRGVIHGYVYYDNSLNPAPNVKVHIYETQTQQPVALGFTNVSGYFIVDNIDMNKIYSIVVEDYESQKKEDITPVNLPDTTNSLTIIIESREEVVGMVQDEEGNPLEGAIVTLKNAQGQSVNSTSTGSFGSFLFRVSPGEYYIEVTLPGYEKYIGKLFIVQQNKVEDRDPITLVSETGILEVYLKDEKGTPIEGFVTIEDVNGEFITSVFTENGVASTSLLMGNYNIIGNATNHIQTKTSVTIIARKKTTETMLLKKVQPIDIRDSESLISQIIAFVERNLIWIVFVVSIIAIFKLADGDENRKRIFITIFGGIIVTTIMWVLIQMATSG